MKKITVLTSLYKCEKYLQGYFDWVRRIDNPEEVEILLLHNAPTKAELDIMQQNMFLENLRKTEPWRQNKHPFHSSWYVTPKHY